MQRVFVGMIPGEDRGAWQGEHLTTKTGSLASPSVFSQSKKRTLGVIGGAVGVRIGVGVGEAVEDRVGDAVAGVGDPLIDGPPTAVADGLALPCEEVRPPDEGPHAIVHNRAHMATHPINACRDAGVTLMVPSLSVTERLRSPDLTIVTLSICPVCRTETPMGLDTNYRTAARRWTEGATTSPWDNRPLCP